MSGKRRPMAVNLSVVESGGGKHWTKEEIDVRTASEVRTPKPKTLTPPKWLNKQAAALFRRYAKLMLELPEGIVSKLDTGTLARYCDSAQAYGEAAFQRDHWMELCRCAIPSDPAEKNKEYEAAEAHLEYWTGQLVKYEKIARGCATELGFTISSRCKLVVPKAAEVKDEDPLEELRRRFQA